MESEQKGAAYNLKVVIQETGLTPDTLRAWERRYGLPQPQRTEGGHRLYSQRDIEIIKWLIARQQEGLSISRATDLWQKLEAEQKDPLQPAETFHSTFPEPSLAMFTGSNTLLDLRQAWLTACTAFDEPQAEQLMAQAFAMYPLEVVCTELLQKGLATIGEMWYAGEATVQQEHFASALTIRRLESLISAAPAPSRKEVILTGTPPEEDHAFVPLLLSLFLRRRGWAVVHLGTDIPLTRLEHAITVIKPHLVVAAAQQLHTAANLLQMSHLLQTLHTPLAFGGRIFNQLPSLRSRIPGYFLGEDLIHVPAAIETILTTPPPLPPVETVSATYQQALTQYQQVHAFIEAEIWQINQQMAIPHDHLNYANQQLSRHIIAALTLGDINLLGNSMTWIEGLLENYRLPPQQLQSFMKLYHQAAKKYLDRHAILILNWLETIIPTH